MQARKPYTAGISTITRQEAEDPIIFATKLRKFFKDTDKGYRSALYKLIATTLSLCHIFNDDAKAYDRLRRDPFWDPKIKQKPKEKPSERDLCRTVALFVFDGSSAQRADRAYKHAKVVRYLWSNGIEPEDVEERLESDGGLEKILKKVTAEQEAKKEGSASKRAVPAKARSAGSDKSVLEEKEIDDAEAEDENDEDGAEGSDVDEPSGRVTKSPPPKRTNAEPPGEEGEQSVRFFASKRRFERLMALEPDDDINVTLTRRAHSGSWRVLVATKLGKVE